MPLLCPTIMLRKRWDDGTLNRVFDKTDGHCYYCGKQLAWNNHGANGRRGAWHVDHSIPLSLGGTDHLNNLEPACINCNLEKGTQLGRNFKRQFEEPASSTGYSWVEIALGLGAAILAAHILSGLFRGDSGEFPAR